MSYKSIIQNSKQKRHRTLILENKNIQPKDVEYIAEELKYSGVTTLHLNNNNIGCEGLKCLAKSLKFTQITNLKVGENNIQDDGIVCLVEALKECTVTELDLRKNNVTFKVIQYLHETLVKTKVKTLYIDIHATECSERFMSLTLKIENEMIKSVDMTLFNNKLGIWGVIFINKIYQDIPLSRLRLSKEELEIDDAVYLSSAFNKMRIMTLEVKNNHIIQENGITYLINAFKSCQIFKLYVSLWDCIPAQWFDGTSIKYLTDFLKEIKIFKLELHNRILRDGNIEDLASMIVDTNIMYIDLGENLIESEGVKHLSRVLKDSKIVTIDLSDNKIDMNGAKYLAEGLPFSQVTSINLEKNCISYEGYRCLREVIGETNITSMNTKNNNLENGATPVPDYVQRTTISEAFHLRHAFKELVYLNSANNEFEFMVPDKNVCPPLNMDSYAFLIKILHTDAKSKVQIFDLICKDETEDYFDFDLMDKIEEFILSISKKFNALIDDKLPALIEMYYDYDYVSLVRQFESIKLHDIVQNLLFHRILYYVDDKQEILHPFIYKLLHKYKLPLFSEHLEPGKKEKIISYYQEHEEIDENVQEIIDLLKSEKFIRDM